MGSRSFLQVRGSWQKTSPELSQKIWLSVDPRPDLRSVGQVIDCSSCPWIDAPKAQLQSQTTIDQHGPSFDPRSVGLTVNEGQQSVRWNLLMGQLQMVITFSKKGIVCPMTYGMIDNWIIFPTPPSLLNSDLRVKSYARFSEALSGRLDLRTQSTDHRLIDGPSVQSVDHSDSS